MGVGALARSWGRSWDLDSREMVRLAPSVSRSSALRTRQESPAPVNASERHKPQPGNNRARHCCGAQPSSVIDQAGTASLDQALVHHGHRLKKSMECRTEGPGRSIVWQRSKMHARPSNLHNGNSGKISKTLKMGNNPFKQRQGPPGRDKIPPNQDRGNVGSALPPEVTLPGWQS